MTFRLLSLVRLPSAGLGTIGAVALFFAMSCAAQEGDVCIVDTDCAGTLVCCGKEPLTSTRGRCGTSDCIVAAVDGGPDAGGDGGGTDAGSPACTADGTVQCTARPGFFCRPTDCTTVGTCESQPMTCPGVLAPVCGCDGVTYLSACNAELVPVGIRASGECVAGPDGGVDGGVVDGGVSDGGVDGGSSADGGGTDAGGLDGGADAG